MGRTEDLKKTQELIGCVTESNLKYVDSYVSNHLGIFIPSVGFCEYAITPQHTHPTYSFLLFVTKEQNLVSVKVNVQPKQILAVAFSPDIPHEEAQTEQFTRYIAICIEKKFYEEIYRKFNDKVPSEQLWEQFAVSRKIMIYINSFLNECESKLAGHNDILDALATIITHSLIRAQLSVAPGKSIIYEKFEIQKVVEYMQQNFGKKLTIKSLAQMVTMSESNFIRLFKKETGLSPMDFLIKLRIEKAKKLLRAGSLNITEVSLQCGFSSTSHFSTSFTKHTGVKPSEFQSK